MTEPYSSIGPTVEQHKAFKKDIGIKLECLIKSNIFRASLDTQVGAKGRAENRIRVSGRFIE